MTNEPLIDYESVARWVQEQHPGKSFHEAMRRVLTTDDRVILECVLGVDTNEKHSRLAAAAQLLVYDHPLALGEYGNPFDAAETVAAFILDGENYTAEYVNARRWIEAWTFGKVYGGENGHLTAIIKTPAFKAWAGRYQYHMASSPGVSFALARQVLEAAASILKGEDDALID